MGTGPLTHWEHFPHGADAGVRGFGPTPAEAFAQAAVALVALVVDVETVVPTTSVEVVCQDADIELLLVDWLNAVVREMSVRRMLFARFDVVIDGADLHATLWGERVDRGRHAPAVEVKGATLTELRVSRTDEGWMAQCVVDV